MIILKSYKLRLILIILILGHLHLYSQVVLKADGPGNTYELINSVLAPGNTAVENPECIHPEFGRHIAEVWDADLNKYVFEFYIHVTPDNDRCINFDRQRVEIKTYEPSPDNLKGVTGETVIYKWKFKIPIGFQPSTNFTHIHQIKAVGGDDDDPIFTLTVRKGSPNKLELIHNNTTKVKTANLSLLEGKWVEVIEKIKINNLHGSYSISIKKVSDNTTILSYINDDLMTIRSDNYFIRPKWGIYRSLLNSQDLRDESLRFDDFSISEEIMTGIETYSEIKQPELKVSSNPITKKINIEYLLQKAENIQVNICNINGQIVKPLVTNTYQEKGIFQKTIHYSDLVTGVYFVQLITENKKEAVKFIIF